MTDNGYHEERIDPEHVDNLRRLFDASEETCIVFKDRLNLQYDHKPLIADRAISAAECYKQPTATAGRKYTTVTLSPDETRIIAQALRNLHGSDQLKTTKTIVAVGNLADYFDEVAGTKRKRWKMDSR